MKTIKVTSKDWDRMLDLVVTNNDGESISNLIKDKNKAIARFVAGYKLNSDERPLTHPIDSYSYFHFKSFYNRAIKLGATTEEIDLVFNATHTPIEYINKLKILSTKKLNNRFVGDIVKAILKNGDDIIFHKTNGNALTFAGKDAMSRNGRKWTIGYKTDITHNGSIIHLNFDAITDEGDGPTYYFIDEYSSNFGNQNWIPLGKQAFIKYIINQLNK